METLKRLLKRDKAQHFKTKTVFEQLNAEFRGDIVKKKSHLAGSPRFNAFIIGMILLNTITIGLEVDYARGRRLQDRLPFFAAEFIFAVIFFVEMVLRLHQLRWDYFADSWNLFDYILVVLSVSDIIVSLTRTDSGGMRLASSLRIFRLLRVVRSIRGVKMVSGLWLIIQGMLDAVKTVFWVGCAAIFFIYIFGVVISTTCGQDPLIREYWHLTDTYTGSVTRSMITVLQVITLDGWIDDVGRPIFSSSPITVIILILAVWVLAYGTLNILVAVMVERTMTMSQDSKENTAKILEKTELVLLESMASDFLVADTTGRGELHYKDFRRMIRTKAFNKKLKLLGIHIDEAESLFKLMDADHSGAITPGEFISGIQKIKGLAKGQDVVQLICFAQKQCLRATRFVDRMRALNEMTDEIQRRLDGVGRGISMEIVHRRKGKEHSAETWSHVAARQAVLGRLESHRRLDYPGLVETTDGL